MYILFCINVCFSKVLPLQCVNATHSVKKLTCHSNMDICGFHTGYTFCCVIHISVQGAVRHLHCCNLYHLWWRPGPLEPLSWWKQSRSPAGATHYLWDVVGPELSDVPFFGAEGHLKILIWIQSVPYPSLCLRKETQGRAACVQGEACTDTQDEEIFSDNQGKITPFILCTEKQHMAADKGC